MLTPWRRGTRPFKKNDIDFYRLATALLLFLSISICDAIRMTTDGGSKVQKVITSDEVMFRNATRDDISDLTTIHIDAFSPSTMWHYLVPGYPKYKDYVWCCERAMFEWEWDNIHTDRTAAKVVEVALDETSKIKQTRVVSAGIWNFLEQNSNIIDDDVTSSPLSYLPWSLTRLPMTTTWSHDHSAAHCKAAAYNCSTIQAINATRVADHNAQMQATKRKYIDAIHPRTLYLNLLATHPDYDGHGYAAQNLRWGLRQAKERGVPATLIATPAGLPLYESMGFRKVQNVSFEMFEDWEGEGLWYVVMEWP